MHMSEEMVGNPSHETDLQSAKTECGVLLPLSRWRYLFHRVGHVTHWLGALAAQDASFSLQGWEDEELRAHVLRRCHSLSFGWRLLGAVVQTLQAMYRFGNALWTEDQGELQGTDLRWHTEPKTQTLAQIFADSPFLLEFQAAGGRRKPQIFAENHRKAQIRVRHLKP